MEEYEIDSSVLDAAHFVSWVLETILPDETEYEMYMEQPWRPAWDLKVPRDQDIEVASNAVLGIIGQVYAEQHILIGYRVHH